MHKHSAYTTMYNKFIQICLEHNTDFKRFLEIQAEAAFQDVAYCARSKTLISNKITAIDSKSTVNIE